MIPSLVAPQLKASIVEYLATTFALSDDEAYLALTGFLSDEKQGIFCELYVRVRLPFVEASENADLGVDWMPPGFRPYAHQVAAWERLSGRGQEPKPTLITTGTGSGKSEAFLIPVIDHSVWARNRSQRGIKALILYPMNTLVTDQQHRIAALLADPMVSAGWGHRRRVDRGDDGSIRPQREMNDRHLITDTAELYANPPDILLTNYKMLDRLLTNAGRQRLWAANTRPAGDAGNGNSLSPTSSLMNCTATMVLRGQMWPCCFADSGTGSESQPLHPPSRVSLVSERRQRLVHLRTPRPRCASLLQRSLVHESTSRQSLMRCDLPSARSVGTSTSHFRYQYRRTSLLSTHLT